MRVGANAGEGKLRHVRLADDHRAGCAKARDDRRVLGCRGRVGEDRGPRACWLPGNVEQVLDADDHAVERPELRAVTRAPVCRIGGFPGCFRINRQEGSFALARGIADAGKNALETIAGDYGPQSSIDHPRCSARRRSFPCGFTATGSSAHSKAGWSDTWSE